MQSATSVSIFHKKLNPLISVLVVVLLLMLIAASMTPNLLRSRMAADQASRYAAMRVAQESSSSGDPLFRADARQVVRTAEMSLLVDDAAKRMEEIHAIAERNAGFVESSQVWRGDGGGSAQITVRVPEPRLDDVRSAVRATARKVVNEKTSANDVTSQSVDLDATLRNYQAEEQQYLAILQRAATVKDTLDVAQRLNDVRRRIERTAAQRKLLSSQVAMATFTVSLRTEAGLPQVSWAPDFRQAWHDAADSMAAYIAAMTSLLLYAPVVLAWFTTVVILLVLTWRTLRWVWTRWLASPQARPAA